MDVSITGNSTNPTRFQHPIAGTYKKECNEKGKKYFSVASGGGTGRNLPPDNMAAGPVSYGMTNAGRMHSDAQFAGSSSVPAHVEMVVLTGMGMTFLQVRTDESDKEQANTILIGWVHFAQRGSGGFKHHEKGLLKQSLAKSNQLFCSPGACK